MRTLIFTGAAGASARAAAATAATAAAAGIKTILAGFGPDHPLAALVGVAPSDTPQPIAEQLTFWTLDPLRSLGDLYDAVRGRNTSMPSLSAIAGEELPLIPGADLFLGVAGLRRYAGDHTLACVDVGAPAAFLRAMAVPDTFRWSLRVLLGLDRDPGRSSASVQRALIPTNLIPFPMEWVGQVQRARAELELLRDANINPQHTNVRYVFAADQAGLAEARIALPALQLYGLSVDGLVAGPLLPEGAARLALEDLAAEQDSVIAEANSIWAPRPILRMAAGATPGEVPALAAIGKDLYAGASPLDLPTPEAPIQYGSPEAPSLAITLPGLRRDDLALTVSGDELIIRVGPYRRHLLLPERLRGVAVRAARQGDALVIRLRE